MGKGIMDPSRYSSLALAWIGDAVYELMVRRRILEEGNRQVQKLHAEGIRYVSAGAQARLMESIEEKLTEEEASVYRRGRNAAPRTTPKNQSVADYHKATGFEALIGWLYLKGDLARIEKLTGIEAFLPDGAAALMLQESSPAAGSAAILAPGSSPAAGSAAVPDKAAAAKTSPQDSPAAAAAGKGSGKGNGDERESD